MHRRQSLHHQSLSLHPGANHHLHVLSPHLLLLHLEEELVKLLCPSLIPPPSLLLSISLLPPPPHHLPPAVNQTANEAPATEIWKKEREMSRRKILGIILVFYLW